MEISLLEEEMQGVLYWLFVVLVSGVLAFALVEAAAKGFAHCRRRFINRLGRVLAMLANVFKVALGVSALVYALGVIFVEFPAIYQIILRTSITFAGLLVLHLMIRQLIKLKQRK